ncbi:MAG: methylenetetrahydrofolate reductase [NAD(P)H] [Hyphomicrobiaceae bacterium]|nr:MAG: methylenetetrahydrofolate reductase [NAD(P)H] [Hyphomicrobiaceae bacterium]
MSDSTARPPAAVAGGPVKVSFEFFPPKSPKMELSLWEAVHRLAPLGPAFVSVTYGAGGSTRERTHATVERILRETSLVPAAHITCVEASRNEVDDVARAYWAAGVRHVVALRGDPPAGPGVRFQPHPEGYSCAADLVAGLKRVADFEITVGAYPEKHPSSPTVMADIDNLKAKVEAGASRAITQFFFDNSHYYRFLDRVRGRGINVPVTPGIVPIHNYTQVATFAQRCGATVPESLRRRFEGLESDPETTRLVAATIAVEQVMDLVDHGVRELHFYTLNRANLVYAICHLLGLRPMPVASAAAA